MDTGKLKQQLSCFNQFVTVVVRTKKGKFRHVKRVESYHIEKGNPRKHYIVIELDKKA